MSFVAHRERISFHKYYRETRHQLVITTLAAGEKVDVQSLRQYERDELGRDWSMEAAPKVMVLSGIGMISTPQDAMVVLPEFGDFRFGLNGVGTTALEAVTDLTYACFSPFNKEAHEMYKLTPKLVDAPFQLSSADGLYLVIINGDVDVNGVEYTTGGRVTLAESLVTVTPVGTAQCVVISDRNAPEPTAAIRSVSPRQIRQALNQTNQRAMVEAAVAASDQNLKDWWEFATLIERNNPQVVGMGAALGLSVEQMDDLFMLAASL